MHVNQITTLIPKRYVIKVSLIVVLVVSILLATTVFSARAVQAHVSTKSSAVLRVRPTLVNLGLIGSAPPSDVQCRAKSSYPCYSPQEMRNAYGITPLINGGITGRGQTILIIDSYGSPTIAQDLKQFDKDYGLPDPPSFRVLSPLGTVPFNPNNSDMTGWADETTLDVEWSHAIAPGANIILLTSPVSETEGVQGLPQFLQLEQYALNNHLGSIISQSWAATENTLFDNAGKAVIGSFESFYQQAAAQHVTIFASAGDSGSSNVDVNNNTYPFPTVGFPSSSPYVTSVGGTSLYADTNGNYQRETVWDEVANSGGAGGGGISQYFSEPDYQRATLPASVQQQLKGYRGIPDISYNADPYTGILIYESDIPGQAGYYEIGGTSEGSPQWAGIMADANQLAGRPLGFLNPALYSIGQNVVTENSSYHDITVGNNGYNNVPGYNATPGWDLATGWGTPRTTALITQLILRCH
jgi:subtilase family serine protease